MNLFIHSVSVLSLWVCVGVNSNSESFYTATPFSEKKIAVEGHLSLCACKIGKIWPQHFFFVGETFLFDSFEGQKKNKIHLHSGTERFIE